MSEVGAIFNVDRHGVLADCHDAAYRAIPVTVLPERSS